LFRLLLGIAVAGSFDSAASAGQFVLVIAGGLLLGVAGGYLVVQLMRPFDDYLVETTLTVILAYGSYFLAEQLQVSGVIAVVAAGLVVGNYGQRVSLSPTSRMAVGLSWEFFGFLANSLIFLFVGLQVRNARLLESLLPITVAILAVLLARAATVGVVSALMRGLRLDRPLPWRWQALLVWGGLRGALSLAMVLSLPYGLGGEGSRLRDELLVLTFGVILFTLLAQGLTIRPLLTRLGLVESDVARRQYERIQAGLRAVRAALDTLDRQAQSGAVSPLVANDLRPEYERREAALRAELEARRTSDAALREQELRAERRRLLVAERAALRRLFIEGGVDDDTYRDLGSDVDARIGALDDAADEVPRDAAAAHAPPAEAKLPGASPRVDKARPD
jgi:CPA1 family monovalent cation:H+ antiporter